MHCEDVVLMPREVPIMMARDTREKDLIDVHTFTKFFTYQIPDAKNNDTNILLQRFDPTNNSTTKVHQGTQRNDLVLRLRASLKSSNMDEQQQGMKVSILDELDQNVIVDGSTDDHDERRVHLDSIELSSSRAYMIKYEFFEKNIGIRSFEDKIISGGHMGASSCSKPFVIQELLIAHKDIIDQRGKKYNEIRRSSDKAVLNQLGGEEHPIENMVYNCNFSTFDNSNSSLEAGEAGLYCNRKTYTYRINEQRADEISIVYTKEFSIVGAQREAVTYLFDLTLGFDFATTAQLKAVLQRVDRAHNGEFIYDPLKCLYDHSCVETEQLGKNEIGISAILTSGDYQITIFDQEENAVRRWLQDEVGLKEVPFSFELQATPVVQNEERVMCGNKLYLHEWFIQNRFIDHKGGQKFIFEDDIILNLVNSSQPITFTPEETMVLKVAAKEAYGVNMAMTLCERQDCHVKSSKVGNTEQLYTVVQKDTRYTLTLDYSNSIVELSTFYDCPHVRLSIAMMKHTEAESYVNEQGGKAQSWIKDKEKESNQALAQAFTLLSTAATLGDAAFLLSGTDSIYVYEVRRDAQNEMTSAVVTEGSFIIPSGTSRQLMVEVYYDPQFYDIELLIESKEASETRAARYSGRTTTDITRFKGAKRVFVEAEPGEYKLHIVTKLPSVSAETRKLNIMYFEFQLYAISAEIIPSRVLRPSSLNYFGLLGPLGKDFGQLSFVLEEVMLGAREFIDLEFRLSLGESGIEAAIDVQAIEMDNKGANLDVSLREIDIETSDDGEGGTAVNLVAKHPHAAKYQDAWEDGVTYEALEVDGLKSNTTYRVRLANRDPAELVTCTLKVVVTEHAESEAIRHPQEVVPLSFDEVARVKPKVPGVKEGSFIQGSRRVMELFKVTSLSPFIPKSTKVYQAVYKTGEGTDDSFLRSLDFEVKEQSTQVYAQVAEYSGKEDLFLSIYTQDDEHGEGSRQVARSSLGKYANALGPMTLPKGKYRLVVHPDQDSASLSTSTELIRFGLDVLLEKPGIMEGDFDIVVAEVELCNMPTLPEDFNGPGFIHPLSGNQLQLNEKFRLAQVLEGTTITFELSEPSLVVFYLALPPGVKAQAAITRLQGTRATKVSTADLNKDDESFLRNEGGFKHRGVIQVREFLSVGKYVIRVQGKEVTGSAQKIQPRCEAYDLGLTVTPISMSGSHLVNAECLDSNYVPEHLKFDMHDSGTLVYPLSESTVDVAYLDLKGDGEGPFIFHFELRYDPRVLGVLGLSLSKYDAEASAFRQSALYRSPQDGLTQILAVVESGVYAVGIQTLTSTDSMFLAGGLNSQAEAQLGGKVLPGTCLEVNYSYLVASTLRGDSRTLEGGAIGLFALLAGDGLSKLVQQRELDGRLLDELGDVSLHASCDYDDLPASLPIIEAGFDRSFTLLAQEKPADFLEIVVETASLLRVSIHAGNSKNQVRAYLLEHPKDTEARAWTVGSGGTATFLHLVEPQKRAYSLKIEYDSLDQDDACPIFDLRIILKPVEAAVIGNLHCENEPLPPTTLEITQDDFEQSGRYSFGSDFVWKATDQGGALEYDITLKWPGAERSAQYYLDVEAKSDVLTGQMTFSLLYTKKDGSLGLLGRSHPVGSAAHGGRFTQRLKLLDREEELAEDVDVDTAVLRLRFPPSSVHIFDVLKENGHLGNAEICHSFSLSIRAELRSGENESGLDIMGPSRLVRVRWEGTEVGNGLFDPASRIYASLEFDRSMKAAYQLLQAQEFASLVAEAPNVDASKVGAAPSAVVPAVKRLSEADPSTIFLEFHGGSLAVGWCHRLQFNALGLGGPDFDVERIGSDLKVCASSCLCNWKGTESCIESARQCQCKFPYTGPDCGQCKEGHTLDPETGECTLSSLCADAGGSETCNGHGQCEQVGAQAVCTCKPGFVHDGLERCAKCSDPLFDYPDCQLRNWVLEEPDVNCKDLEYEMPRKLWRDGSSASNNQPLQGEDGEVNWAQRYRLKDGPTLRKSSSHYFIVPEASVFRLFVDTGRSGATVKYILSDDESNELLSSASAGQDSDQDGFLENASEFIVLHQPAGKEPSDAPFKLKISYKHTKHAIEGQKEDERCPTVDIHIVMEPLVTAREALRCDDEEKVAAAAPRSSGWSFDSSSKFVQEEIMLSSADMQLFRNEGLETTHFATLRYSLDIRQAGNALSIVTTYPFSELSMSLSLYDERTGGIIQSERTASLEGDRESGTPLSAASDMASFVEVPKLDAGRYRLEIVIRRSMFLPTKQYPTCLAFGLVVEYVARDRSIADTAMYEILAVFPMTLNRLDPSEERVIEVSFDRHIVLDDLVDGFASRFYVCQLVNTRDPKDRIHPHSVRTDAGSSLRLDFDFAQAAIPASDRCYKLQCSTKDIKGTELIHPMQAETSYCFATSVEHDQTATARCNPLAQPKLHKDGSCICAAPYTGRDCESCEAGFKAHAETPSSGSRSRQTHIRCLPDLAHLASTTCNSHGRPKSSRVTSIKDVECECDAGYGGRYCDYCLDATHAYPDCDASLSATIYDSEAAHAFLSRKKYEEHGYSTSASKYFPPGSLEPTVFNEECGWVDFPDDIDRAELAREFGHGEFHLADVYVVNHRQDNIIKFVPRNTGYLKVLLQQPEAEEELAGDAQAPFDIEIGVYDPRSEKFLASSMNRHLILPSGQTAKLEYASLSFEVNKEHLEKPLYIFFRALNFTDEDGAGHKDREGCLALYIELEFKANGGECARLPGLQSSTQITVLKDQSQAALVADAARGTGDGAPHSVSDFSSTFFAYQDFYVPEDSGRGGDSDWEVSISLQQKFIESNTLDFVVEVLETDVALQDVRQDAHPARANTESRFKQGLESRHYDTAGGEMIQGRLGPICSGLCLVGGEKAYNEMMRRLELGAGTYFRIWLMQETPPNRSAEIRWCANYQLLVSARRSAPDAQLARLEQADGLRCQASELPETLNTHRYLLGLNGEQKDFHYRQSYRVDHLWHNQAHKVAFKLQEPSVLRVVAPLHRHLEFVLILNQDQGPYSHKTVLTAKREDYHSTLFAQLAPGEYHLKLAFVSDAALIQLPCQTVQLEMAIMTVERAKLKASLIRAAAPSDALSSLSLAQLFLKSPSGPLTLYKHAALGWRHVEPGLPPYVDQRELYVEILREGFEVSQEDNAGIDIEIQSDFLLSGVNVAISNVATGQVVEDERKDSSGRLVVGHLSPGSYELIVYTHESLTNMDPEHGVAISSFDLLLTISVRLLREEVKGIVGKEAGAAVTVELLDYSQSTYGGQKPRVKDSSNASPFVIPTQEFKCFKEYLPLPKTLDALSIFGFLDMSETFYVPTSEFHSHEISFTAKPGQDALRVLLAKANTKVSLIETSSRSLLAQSRPVEAGKAQLLIATKLKVSIAYTIILEFSAATGSGDGQAAAQCEHFVLAVRTWDSEKTCISAGNLLGVSSLPTNVSINPEQKSYTIILDKQAAKSDLRVDGTGLVDLTITLDYSDSFYRAELILKSATGEKVTSLSSSSRSLSGEESDVAAVIDLMQDVAPNTIELVQKHETTYHFTDVPSGGYQVRLRQKFKETGCGAPLTLTIHAQKASESASKSDMGPHSPILYQSQAEEQEQPRTASKLPLNLGSFKFTGGESQSGGGTSLTSGYLLFSGPVQLDELESQNRIAFEIGHDQTLVRLYAEHEGLAITLEDSSTEHSKVLSAGSGANLMRTLDRGQYTVKLSLATAHGRQSAALAPPEVQLTIMLADPDTHSYYNKTWEQVMGSKCSGDASFPLALRQQKQTDSHQLYYNYPLIKVSPSVLERSSVLQTYNFRVNVTSRMYFEVGMHLINSHVTLQLTTLGSTSGHAIQGKQRGNLNVLDVQVGPGDYSVAIKQVALPGTQYVPTCGLFSLQGLFEPINLMSTAANSGEILQRGIAGCVEASNGDILPPKIYGSKSLTRGGGELHVDSTGHFMRRFRNVLFKSQRGYAGIDAPYDRVELEPVEDALLHLSFLYDGQGGRELRVHLADTWMLGQEASPLSSVKLSDLDAGHVERVFEYKLTKGRHYALTVYYVGGTESEAHGRSPCSTYDLTMAITHITRLSEQTACRTRQKYESLHNGLPHVITDRDLDGEGSFTFDKVLKVQHPEDLTRATKLTENGKTMVVLLETISIDLRTNFDIRATIDFEYDQALFGLGLTESVSDDSGDWQAEVTHEQSPLVFKGNNDHYKTVRRELAATDVESESRTRKHTLTITNWQPEILALATTSQGARDASCTYVHVQIHIRASQRTAENLFRSQSKRSSAPPVLAGCRPDESPVFVHGRPSIVHFDLIFNTQPFLHHHSSEERQDEQLIAEAIRLKVSTISLTDSSRTNVHIAPSSVRPSGVGYRDDEYHVAVMFDLTEFQHTATEKVVSAQLVVFTAQLVDVNDVKFANDRKLAARGLPIYVFEQNDEEQLLQEETSEVRAAIQDTALGDEVRRGMQGDVSTEVSDLEAAIDPVETIEVQCLCAHGPCRQGQSTCSGRCDSGWTGPHCDTPTDQSTLSRVNRNKDKDYTGDGLYRPQAISDQLYSGGKEQPRSRAEPQVKRAQRIEGEIAEHSTALREQMMLEPTTGPVLSTEQDDSSDSKSKNTSSLLMLALIGFVLYSLYNGVTLPSWPSRNQRKYSPLGENSREDSDEEEDPNARRRLMEMSSFGSKGAAASARRDEEELGYHEARKAPSSSSFPMASFSKSPNKESTNNRAPQQEEDTAIQLQRELELFAQDDDEEEDAALIQFDGDYNHSQQRATARAAYSGAQPQNSSHDQEIQEFERYFDQ